MYSSVECSSCSSKNQRRFDAELALHFPGLDGLNKPIVWAFPEVLLCLDCGFAVFALDDEPLQQLHRGDELSDSDNLERAA
jgi:hypothetical protein